MSGFPIYCLKHFMPLVVVALYTVNNTPNIKVHLEKEQIIDKTKYAQTDRSIIMKCYLIEIIIIVSNDALTRKW